MQVVDAQSQEDIIAEKILKRAEIARITRQLKSKLFKAGLKVRESQGKIPSPSTSPVKNIQHKQNERRPTVRSIRSTSSLTTPMKRKSLRTLDESDEEFSSPVKRMHNSSVPSSPFYSQTSPSNHRNSLITSSQQTQKTSPPKTPPSNRYTSLNVSALQKTPTPPKNGSSTNSASQALQNALYSTPKSTAVSKVKDNLRTPNTKFANESEEGADLLLYMSNSPARTNARDSRDYNQLYMNILSTPKAGSSNQGSGTTPNTAVGSTTPPPRLTLPFATPSGQTNTSNPAPANGQITSNPNISSNNILPPLPTTPNTNALNRSAISDLNSSSLNTPTNNATAQYFNLSRFHTPATPQNKFVSRGANALNKTPGFSMSDYVNIFTPSPRATRTPDFHALTSNRPAALLFSGSGNIDSIINSKNGSKDADDV